MCLLPSSEDRTTDVISQAKKKLKEFFDSFRPDFISYSGTGIIRELFKVTRIFKRKEETNKQTNKNTQNMSLTTTPSAEVVQMLAYATSERGLNREFQVACLG